MFLGGGKGREEWERWGLVLRGESGRGAVSRRSWGGGGEG